MNCLLMLCTIAGVVVMSQAGTFAPYFYVQNGMNLVQLKQDSGIKALTLAFALSSGTCNPAWDAGAIDSPALVQQFQAFKSAGGQIIVSTGGAGGNYLENSCGDSNSLAAAFKKVIQTTGATGLDLDIEANEDFDKVMTAVKTVQQQTGVTVSFTVPADENGISAAGVQAVKTAIAKGVNVGIVNPMAMDYTSNSASFGDSVIKVVESTHNQLKGLYPGKSDAQIYAMQGVTPMIGVNDCCGFVFGLSDAQKLVTYAKSKGLGRMGIWSINRDQQCPAGTNTGVAQATCSGVQQSKYQFMKTLNQL